MNQALIELGWSSYFESQLNHNEKSFPARIAEKNRGHFKILTTEGVFEAVLSGKYLHTSSTNAEYPCVGDWVIVHQKMDQTIIEKLLNRKSAFARRQKIDGGRKIINGIVSGGTTQEQILAANIDVVFIVTGLDKNFNHKRIERYLTLSLESGAMPVIILSKLDLCEDIEDKIRLVESVAMGFPIHALSALDGTGMASISKYLGPGKTVAFLGSSGVGKSTISNFILGKELQETKATNAQTGKGVHTTTSAQLIQAPDGSLILDTPGLREIQLWCDEDTVDTSFSEIVRLSELCKFNNCNHGNEPGCAIREALSTGELAEDRYERYLKMQKEVAYLEKRKQGVESRLNKRVKTYEKRNSEKKYLKAQDRW